MPRGIKGSVVREQETALRKQRLKVESGGALDDVSVLDLLAALQRRGGTFKAVADAQLLVLKKSADYNQAGMLGQDAEATAQADRDVYFPFAGVSYAQMIHVKAQRLNSLVLKSMRGAGESNYEGIRDTLLDIINYSSFWVERQDRSGS